MSAKRCSSWQSLTAEHRACAVSVAFRRFNGASYSSAKRLFAATYFFFPNGLVAGPPGAPCDSL
jgi:hypothetical protein